MPTNSNVPSTDEEKEALRQALTSRPRYVVSSKVTVVVLDEEQVRRDALAKIDTVRFDDPAAADQMRGNVQRDIAEALSFLTSPGELLAGVAGVHVRSSNHAVRLEAADAP